MPNTIIENNGTLFSIVLHKHIASVSRSLGLIVCVLFFWLSCFNISSPKKQREG